MEMSANSLILCANPWGRGERGEGREVSSHAGRLVSEQGFFVPFLSGWSQPALTLDYVTQSFSSQ